MKGLKGWIPTGFLAATLLLGSITANAGIITAGFASTDNTTTSDPCTVDQDSDSTTTAASLNGIITAGFKGIITAGFTSTGIIVTDLSSNEPAFCGIIVTD